MTAQKNLFPIGIKNLPRFVPLARGNVDVPSCLPHAAKHAFPAHVQHAVLVCEQDFEEAHNEGQQRTGQESHEALPSDLIQPFI